jgi:hypothetical protein
MSSTRYARSGAPISDERFMSSPELAQLRAISGTAVAARCKVLASPVKRELLFFLQAMSIKGGGLIRLAHDLASMFPKRIGTPTMHRLRETGKLKCTKGEAAEIDNEIMGASESERNDRLVGELLSAMCREEFPDREEEAERRRLGQVPSCAWQEKFAECREAAIKAIPTFITDLCINPRMDFCAPGEERSASIKTESRLRRESLGDDASKSAEMLQFDDIISALFEYKRQHENSVEAGFCHTAITRKIWAELDAALKTRTMALINGLPGRGKTEAVRAWCECHLGVARFVSLDGTSTKTAQFRELARALGLGHGAARKAQEMQATVKEVLQGSGIMPVIDEAHFFFEQSTRITTRPEMLDWIDTALCNPPIPVALITTPQFMTCMERAAIQAEWNYLQFQRRCKRTIELPPRNTPEDVKAVAKHLLPEADANTIRLVLGYEKLSGRDLSAVGDAVREAKRLAEESGERRVGFEHVDRAINELVASDQPWALLRRRVAEGLQKKKAGRRIAAALDLPQDHTPGARHKASSEPLPQSTPGARRDTLSRQSAPEQTRGMTPVELNTIPA